MFKHFQLVYGCCTLHTLYQHMLYIVNYIQVHHVVHYKMIRTYTLLLMVTAIGSAIASFGDFGNFAQENTTVDILVEDQLCPPLDMVTVDQVCELPQTKQLN